MSNPSKPLYILPTYDANYRADLVKRVLAEVKASGLISNRIAGEIAYTAQEARIFYMSKATPEDYVRNP